jgi:hypothetical protein
MKLLTLVFLTLPLAGQTSFVGAGVSYSPSTSPKLVGHVWAALEANQKTRTYSWTVVDILYSRHQALTTAIESGADQWIRNFGPVELHALGGVGAAVLSLAGNSTVGGAGTFGGLVIVPLKGGFALGFNARVIKTTGAAGAASQASVGIDVLWGK